MITRLSANRVDDPSHETTYPNVSHTSKMRETGDGSKSILWMNGDRRKTCTYFARTRKLNAIKPNPTAVNVNASTSTELTFRVGERKMVG